MRIGRIKAETASRRTFLVGAATVGALPLFNIGGLMAAPLARRVAQGGRIRVALIGCGAQMTGLIRRMGGDRNVQVVALVDPLPSGIRAVKASAKKFYGSFDFTGAWEGADYREMFEKVGDRIDAAFIATPNHHHAIPALMAIRRGIHVYVEKPLALTLEEVALLAREAKRFGVVTQVGNYGHSTKAMRMCVDAVKNGVIGDVTEVYCYSDRVNSMFFRPPASPPPKGMDWDIWCGPAPVCEFYGPHEGRTGFHPHDWHSWIGYGNGSIGNMGTHIMDAPFWALDLGKSGPESVEALDVQFACPGAWAWRDTIDYRFPARGDMPPVTLHWWDGVKDGIPYSKKYVGRTGVCHKREYQNLPPIIEETEREYGLAKAPFLNMGSLFVGAKGKIWFSHHSAIRFFPKTLGQEVKKSKKFTYKTTEHTLEFYAAIREGREANTGFGYSVPLAETLLLGNVAARAGKKKLLWDGKRITNDEAANAFLATTYRPGWELA